MKIGIDARFYGSIGKGLGRYTQKLIENLEKIDTINQYFIFLRKENFDEYQPKNPNFKKVLADFRWYTLAEQIKLPGLLNKCNLDLVHFPHFNVPILYRKKFVVTIHDLILIHFPTIRGTTLNPLFYWLKFLVYKIIINSAIKRARKIISVSQFTKSDILKNYQVPAEKIAVTYEAADNYCYLASLKKENVLEKYKIKKTYLLYVGNAYPHKNLEKLVLAFRKISNSHSDLHLVLVGKEDYFYRRLRNFVKSKKIGNIIFADYVPDDELDTIYREALFYVFPSLYEGFGLPPLEAMAKGVPVACSDYPCMQEILSNSAHYFDAKDVEKIAESIETLIKDELLRKNLVELGYQQIKKYNWKEMAEKTLRIYRGFKI